jgi:hypothetical protein
MVNEQMVNKFMDKKQYIYPSVEVATVKTVELMAFTEVSDTPNHPGQQNNAPARRTDVF